MTSGIFFPVDDMLEALDSIQKVTSHHIPEMSTVDAYKHYMNWYPKIMNITYHCSFNEDPCSPE